MSTTTTINSDTRHRLPVERFVVWGPAPYGGTYYAAGATADEAKADAERVAANWNATAASMGWAGRCRIEHRAAVQGPVVPSGWSDFHRPRA